MWVHQIKGCELGNFVMTTPAIYYLYKQHGRVPVYFDTEMLKGLYQNSLYIDILSTKPKTSPIITSNYPKKIHNKESDYEAYFRIVKGKGDIIPFVGPVKQGLLNKDCVHVAVMNGCLGKKHIESKTIPYDVCNFILQQILSSGFVPVIIGSEQDKKYWEKVEFNSKCKVYLGKLSLLDSVSILSECDSFISNDTGLYHVSAAIGLPGHVCWKYTNFYKNKCPSKKVSFSFGPQEWNIGISTFLESIQ